MKAIQIGSKFEIYGDDLKTHNFLPPQVYTVKFAKMTGFYLELHSPFSVDEKIYGVHLQKVDKVLNAFKRFNRNLGVILSGHKGIGKSIFARMLGMKAVEQGIPVIIVEEYFPGIASYIESIEQEVMVFFDEFDKTFSKNDDEGDGSNPQTSLLSLFDGVASGKKLFVITCNNIYSLSEYFVNRPGRFHYHFRFKYPSAEEIQEYLRDKLAEKYWPEIETVIEFSRRIDLNYDCLRAIAFELASGASLYEAIKDMNIINMDDSVYDATLYYDDGTVLKLENTTMNMFEKNRSYRFWFSDSKGNAVANIAFSPTEGKYSPLQNGIMIDGECLTIRYDNREEDAAELKKKKPMHLTITKTRDEDIHYALA